MWKEADAPDGRKYYYNTVTNETTWTKPAEFGTAEPAPLTVPAQQPATGAWREATNPADGRKYYYNSVTKETTWEKPAAFQQAPAPSGQEDFAQRDRRDRFRDDGPPRSANFEGGRQGNNPWDKQENMGFRGAQPAKLDEPEYSTPALAQEAFFKFLRSQGVKWNTTWEDALRNIVREKGYRAIKNPGERKEAFEKYCAEEQQLEERREQERKQRLRQDFRSMLQTHDDIKHYTRWNTAKPMLEREIVFRNAGNDDVRRALFREYIADLQKDHVRDEAATHDRALYQLDSLMKALVLDPHIKWEEAEGLINKHPTFTENADFRSLSKTDVLRAFGSHLQDLDQERNSAKQKQKKNQYRRQREARDDFRSLLQEHVRAGRITATTKWQDFYPKIAKESAYQNLLGTLGSTPLDLFWDVVEDEERRLRPIRDNALDVLLDQRFEMTPETQMAEFEERMRSDRRMHSVPAHDIEAVYTRLMDKVKRRQREEKILSEKDQANAVDALRSAIRHLEPPVRIDDKYDDIVPAIEHLPEFRALDDEARRIAFNKHIRRMRDKDEERERERLRRDRDRDREHRNGSRRSYDHERDRDRRHRTRSPEIDAYEADRRKAQADRERQYRKASFGLTPPPRDRRDDRYERDRRSDKYDSVYDRERREREMERERSYISRADPRDKGKISTLDYGDEEPATSRPGSSRKRRESEISASSRRDVKRTRRDEHEASTTDAMDTDKQEDKAMQSGSEEGEIEEV